MKEKYVGDQEVSLSVVECHLEDCMETQAWAQKLNTSFLTIAELCYDVGASWISSGFR